MARHFPWRRPVVLSAGDAPVDDEGVLPRRDGVDTAFGGERVGNALAGTSVSVDYRCGPWRRGRGRVLSPGRPEKTKTGDVFSMSAEGGFGELRVSSGAGGGGYVRFQRNHIHPIRSNIPHTTMRTTNHRRMD